MVMVYPHRLTRLLDDPLHSTSTLSPTSFCMATAILRITLSPFVEGLGLAVIDSIIGISPSGLLSLKVAFVSKDFLVSKLSLIELLFPELSYIFEL